MLISLSLSVSSEDLLWYLLFPREVEGGRSEGCGRLSCSPGEGGSNGGLPGSGLQPVCSLNTPSGDGEGGDGRGGGAGGAGGGS